MVLNCHKQFHLQTNITVHYTSSGSNLFSQDACVAPALWVEHKNLCSAIKVKKSLRDNGFVFYIFTGGKNKPISPALP